MTTWINGAWVGKEDAKVSVYDHGFLYGDGLFEGIRAYNGRIFRLNAHLRRLYDGAKALMIHIPMEFEALAKLLDEAIVRETKAGNPDCYIRLVVTRGPGPLGLDPTGCDDPGIFIIVDAIRLYPSEYYEKGVPVITSAIRRHAPDSQDSRIKSLNYLNNILAKMQARQAGALEAIMLNHEGFVAECTGDNIIAVRNGLLRIPAVYHGALEGITLAATLEIARDEGFETEVSALTLFDLYTADELVLTGTAAEIVPVRTLDGRVIAPSISAGEWQPGPITRILMNEFQKRLKYDANWAAGQ